MGGALGDDEKSTNEKREKVRYLGKLARENGNSTERSKILPGVERRKKTFPRVNRPPMVKFSA